MAEKIIEAKLRTEDFGSAGSRRVVRAGRIPGVIYGKNGVKHITICAHDFELTLRVLACGMPCTVALEGQNIPCILKQFQENICNNVLQHVDFMEV